MKCKTLFETIDNLNAEYVGVWEDLCNIESPTASKAGVDAVGAYCMELARRHGWKIDVYPQTVSGDMVCITMNPEAAGRPISLSGHMDTVHPLGSFGKPAVHFDDDKIYGPGVCDCKGGIVAGLLAMDALERCGFTARPVMMLLQSDEEGGSRGSNKQTIGQMCECSKNADAFLNLEGFREGWACIQRKGIVTFRLTVHGEEAHSANCATTGSNAILEAAHKIIELEKIKDDDGLTCNCSVIKGGTVANTVPGRCSFLVNVRFATQEQFDWICGHVQAVADEIHVPGCSCDVEQVSFRVAMERVPRNLELLDKMNDIWEANGLPRLGAGNSKGGSDAADVTVYGIPCIDSIGVQGGKIHAPGEYAYLTSLAESAKRVASVVMCL